MSYADEYKKCARIIEEFPGEARKVLQKAMESAGETKAGLATKLNTNKVRMTRFFNGQMKITAEECHRIARALGGTLRVEMSDNGEEHVFFDNKSESLDELLQRIQGTENRIEKAVIAGYEIPPTLLRTMGLQARDFTIVAPEPQYGQIKLFGEESHLDGFRIFFEHLHVSGIRFGIMMSPDGYYFVPGCWAVENQEESEKSLIDYKKELGLKDYDDQIFTKFAEEQNSWIPHQYAKSAISAHPLDLRVDSDELYQTLVASFNEYGGLVEGVRGVAVLNTIRYAIVDKFSVPRSKEEYLLPQKTVDRVKRERGRECELDPSHELFEGEDGEPYVDIVPIIPLTEKAIEEYGRKILKPTNTAVLCPMCRAKLKHGNQEIKERILLNLYDKHIEDMKSSGLDISRFELLFWRNEADKNKKGVIARDGSSTD